MKKDVVPKYEVVLTSETVARFMGKKMICIGGLRKGREGRVIEVAFYPGSGGLHVKLQFPNGVEHLHHIETVKLVTLG